MRLHAVLARESGDRSVLRLLCPDSRLLVVAEADRTGGRPRDPRVLVERAGCPVMSVSAVAARIQAHAPAPSIANGLTAPATTLLALPRREVLPSA